MKNLLLIFLLSVTVNSNSQEDRLTGFHKEVYTFIHAMETTNLAYAESIVIVDDLTMRVTFRFKVDDNFEFIKELLAYIQTQEKHFKQLREWQVIEQVILSAPYKYKNAGVVMFYFPNEKKLSMYASSVFKIK